MASIVSSIVPLLITATILALMMLFTMGIGWVSGKLLKRLLGIGGK
jgi:putative Mn2+ efflux pump MntP